MAVSVTINGSNYNLPTQGDSPPWGDDLSNTIQAMVNVLNSLNGTGDITITSFTVPNNQVTPLNVTGLNFDTSTVRSAIISYSIYRSSATPNELSECGQIYITYKSTANSWELAQSFTGSSGITFTITNAGQIQITSTDIGATSYVGKLKFYAKSFTQA